MHSIWKKDFPALAQGKTSYLDSAATCQVPESVITAISQYLANGQGNAHRGMHRFSETASQIIDSCRAKLANFIGCSEEQLIFTKGTTESINLVAAGLRNRITAKDSILVTELEHHSNLLPWQRLCQQTGARLNILPLEKNGELNTKKLDSFLQDHCKLFAMSHCSNVLGTPLPIDKFIKKAKNHGVKTLVDGAQWVSHAVTDLKEIGCDFYAFSGHKLYATAGSGGLFCSNLESIETLLLGGGSVARSTREHFELHKDVRQFEAGSANITAIVGLSAAIDYLQMIGFEKIALHERKLQRYLLNEIKSCPNFKIISHSKSKNCVSFYHKKIHCHDIASILAQKNIAVRAGQHCAQPCLKALGIKHCLRASLGLYNDFSDINKLIAGLKTAEKIV